MDKREIMVVFNNQYKEFLEDIERYFYEKEVKQLNKVLKC